MPISNLCIATDVKYEGGRGVGENILYKTTREYYRGGTGTPQGLDFFLLHYITFLFCCFGLIPLIPKIDHYIISHNIVI